jgi:hypothetical protein
LRSLSVYFRSGCTGAADLQQASRLRRAGPARLRRLGHAQRGAGYLINPAKPALIRIRLPKAALTDRHRNASDLLTDRNQKLAKVQEARPPPRRSRILREP